MDENLTAAIVAVSLFGALGALAISIKAIARAWVERGRDEARLLGAGSPQTDARLGRLEQAVDAIAVEVERISEAQRFTAQLLREQGNVAQLPRPPQNRVSPDTPT